MGSGFRVVGFLNPELRAQGLALTAARYWRSQSLVEVSELLEDRPGQDGLGLGLGASLHQLTALRAEVLGVYVFSCRLHWSIALIHLLNQMVEHKSPAGCAG